MRILSMTGFRKICEELAPASFIFDTENQPGGANRDAKTIMRYSDVVFMLNPNRICFKNEMGTLCFNRVKLIRYHDDPEVVGKLFSIVCGDSCNENQDMTYAILVDRKILKSKL